MSAENAVSKRRAVFLLDALACALIAAGAYRGEIADVAPEARPAKCVAAVQETIEAVRQGVAEARRSDSRPSSTAPPPKPVLTPWLPAVAAGALLSVRASWIRWFRLD